MIGVVATDGAVELLVAGAVPAVAENFAAPLPRPNAVPDHLLPAAAEVAATAIVGCLFCAPAFAAAGA